jgi:ubiquitin-like 1-activating enzyme E1 B
LYLDKILPPEEFTAEENGNGEIENPTVSAMVTLGLKNPQKIWDVQENARVFLETIRLFFKRRSKVTGLVPCFESAGSLQLQLFEFVVDMHFL